MINYIHIHPQILHYQNTSIDILDFTVDITDTEKEQTGSNLGWNYNACNKNYASEDLDKALQKFYENLEKNLTC